MLANINVKTDESVKKKADVLFAELGLNMSTAINIFLRQAIYEHRIPFEIYRDEIPNQKTMSAIQESEDMISHSEKYKWYDDVDEMFKETLNEV